MEVKKTKKISSARMSNFFKRHWADKALPSMHWFRKAPAWYHLSFSYNNPYNVDTVHSELFALQERIGRLSDLMADRTLVFLGTGVGDTEMFIVERILKKENKTEVVAIDVNDSFLSDFQNSLRNKELEHPDYQIKLQRIHGIFEEIETEDILYGSPGTRAFICLGNTVGNYINRADFVDILVRLTVKGDLVLLGFQLDTYLKELFAKYSSNPLFEEFILSYLPRAKKREIKWKLDDNAGSISAFVEDVRVFFTKKFKINELEQAMSKRGFNVLFNETNAAKNVCIQLSRRK